MSETRYLNRASLSLSACAHFSVCGSGRAQKMEREARNVQMKHFTLWWLNSSVNKRITCVPNRGDWSVRIFGNLRLTGYIGQPLLIMSIINVKVVIFFIFLKQFRSSGSKSKVEPVT